MAHWMSSLGPRLAILGAFNATVYVTYVTIIERSKKRGGSFERDGYEFWGMWQKPKHLRSTSDVHILDDESKKEQIARLVSDQRRDGKSQED